MIDYDEHHGLLPRVDTGEADTGGQDTGEALLRVACEACGDEVWLVSPESLEMVREECAADGITLRTEECDDGALWVVCGSKVVDPGWASRSRGP